ncbi:MFS general substrate transporter [Tothia fuscella]|uniref:MFS general substrate transporter n=1 Tax=Tothia fuscella TaxID=1048955 RepID=A0A9P4NKC6_9PEZI|nr:MFS general substrate transporter [Tothia fuscella]
MVQCTAPSTPTSPSSVSVASKLSKAVENGVIYLQKSDEENPAALIIPEKDKTSIEEDLFLAKWLPNDPENPYNWSTKRKSWITFQLGMLAFAASLASSITAPANAAIAAYTGVSREVSILSISLYILGFVFGPCIWAPVSELWGRKLSMLPAMIGLGLFSIGCGLSQNAATVFVARFFSGVFGSAPVSNVAASLGDIWLPKVRGTAMTLYAVAVVGGPTLGPIIGGAVTVSKGLGWRWTEYLLAIWVSAVVLLTTFCFPEVYAPYLLKKRAQKLRKDTGDDRYHHPHEGIKLDLNSIVTKHFARPVLMLTTEPMVSCIAVYASFVFGLLYMTLEVFPIVYHEHRGWPLFTSTLPFGALFIGVLCAVGINLSFQPQYARAVEAAEGKPVPESRLPAMAVGAFLFVIGLFVFAWTADPPTPWPVSVVAIGFIGAGFTTIFQQCINFLVDTYRLYAASAVSANTFLRSCLAAGLPLLARPMYTNLGVGPATSILGGIAALALPVPFLFMKYGLALRKRSRFAPVE